MAKISELTDAQLSMSIDKYTARLAEDSTDEKNQKILKQLELEIKKRSADKLSSPTEKALNSGNSQQRVKPGVQKFHSSDVDYSVLPDASFKHRALAAGLDGVFYAIFSQIISAVLGIVMKSNIVPVEVGAILVLLVSFIILPLIYYVMPLKKTGQTLGKKILKVKVVSLENNEALDLSTVVKREFLGKMLSSIVFMIGFIVHLFGRPTWHDSIANTRVIKVS
jgi:uncharacterized RDD family membrane protein YckC